jgi:hypothetical protein
MNMIFDITTIELTQGAEAAELRIIALICGTSTDLVVLSGAGPFLAFCLNPIG